VVGVPTMGSNAAVSIGIMYPNGLRACFPVLAVMIDIMLSE